MAQFSLPVSDSSLFSKDPENCSDRVAPPKVYIAVKDSTTPEGQVISTEKQNILLRYLKQRAAAPPAQADSKPTTATSSKVFTQASRWKRDDPPDDNGTGSKPQGNTTNGAGNKQRRLH